MAKLSDHAGARPGARATKDAGYDGSIRYLANSPERGLPNKIILPEEAREYMELGLFLVSNWQHGKNDTADWKRGYDGGKWDAAQALEWHFKCGGTPFTPIYFSIDDDVNINQWNSLCAPYLQGAASVLDKQWVGVYGGLNTMEWAVEDDLVGHNGQGQRWLWQTKAWSMRNGTRTWHPLTVLRQELVVPPDYAEINGIKVDVNYTYAEDFGQWRNRDPQATGDNEDSAEWQLILGQMLGRM